LLSELILVGTKTTIFTDSKTKILDNFKTNIFAIIEINIYRKYIKSKYKKTYYLGFLVIENIYIITVYF